MATTFNTNVPGTAGSDDIGSTSTNLNQLIRGGAGDDVLRGGKGDDRIYGGAGDDIMSGGGGADQFYFKGGDVVVGTSDTDRIVDLNFGAGDTIVFDDMGGNFFGQAFKQDGFNVFDGGNDAIVSSFSGLHHLVDGSNGAISVTGSAKLDLLILTIDYGNDQTQVIRISNAYNAYLAADFGA